MVKHVLDCHCVRTLEVISIVRLFIAMKGVGQIMSDSGFVAVKRCKCLIFACHHCVTDYKGIMRIAN